MTVEEAETLRRDQEARLQRAIADFQTARPAGGIDLARLYEENLIDGIVYEREAGALDTVVRRTAGHVASDTK